MRFSGREVISLAKAWLATSLAFAILNKGLSFSIDFLVAMILSAITVGLGFLLHELAHKYLAQRYGCRAEFKSFDGMLLLTIAMSFVGFIMAAPGAVFIEGRVNTARDGRISAVGPLVNILLAYLFFVALIGIALFYPNKLLMELAYYGLTINGWLGLFNLIPFWQMDGVKVFQWNKKVYAVMILAAVISMALPRFLTG